MLHDGQRALELLGELNTLERLEGLVREQLVGDEGRELHVQAHIALHEERRCGEHLHARQVISGKQRTCTKRGCKS